MIVTLALPRTAPPASTRPGYFDWSRWDIFNDRAFWRAIGGGYLNTLKMAGLAAVLAIVIGVLFSFVRTARSAIVRVPTTIVLEFFRGMPVLLMMLFILLVFSAGPTGRASRRSRSTTARSSARSCGPGSRHCRAGSARRG